ncbi:MAG: cell filamentation protein Fic [Fimbriimonadales bacterium]|nr:MAG: cell filamentation protein Fic [Fimbriimonadales bacterium]
MEKSQFSVAAWGRLEQRGQGKASYWAFIPNPLPPPFQYDAMLINALSEADRALGELAGLGRTLANPYLLARPLIAREAVMSSRIEGTQADLFDLYAYEAALPALPGFAIANDTREVYQYVQAMEYGLQRLQELPMSLRLIQEIHRVLLQGVRGGYAAPGEFRTTQNWIGAPGCTLSEARYVPPPPDAMRNCLYSFETYLHQPDEHPPLVRLAWIHYQFEAIHPFIDGNGRTGRLLIVLLMIDWNLLPTPLLYLSEYFERHRGAYYDLLQAVSERGAWREWTRFFLQGVHEQAQKAVRTLRKLQDLHARWKQILATAGIRSAVASVALDMLMERPVVTPKDIEKRAGCTAVGARRALQELEQAGIIAVQGTRRPRLVYYAPEVMTILHSD